MKKGWEVPKCGICGKSGFDIIWDDSISWMSKGVFRIVKCNNCGLVYLSPRPSKSIIDKYYQEESYWGTNISDFSKDIDYERREKAYGIIYKDIFHRLEKGSILDIGSGTGLFLTKFKERGWKVEGIELSKKACEYAKKVYGISLRNGDFLDYKIPRSKYDVVTLNGCLEHLHNPKKTLEKINFVLKKSGILIISVPNFDSLGRRIFGKEWFALQQPTHLYHFSSTTLKKLLVMTGYKNVEIKHSYFRQNYYVIFESIRMFFSPKFIKAFNGGLVDKEAKNTQSKQTFKLVLGKISANIITIIIVLLEQFIKKGEVIVAYGEKN